MTTAHQLMVMANHDPMERIPCAVCAKPYPAARGVAYCSNYKKPGDHDWTLGFLLYCSWECVLTAAPPEGRC